MTFAIRTIVATSEQDPRKQFNLLVKEPPKRLRNVHRAGNSLK